MIDNLSHVFTLKVAPRRAYYEARVIDYETGKIENFLKAQKYLLLKNKVLGMEKSLESLGYIGKLYRSTDSDEVRKAMEKAAAIARAEYVRSLIEVAPYVRKKHVNLKAVKKAVKEAWKEID